MPETLITIPTYNERQNIELLLPDVRAILPDADILIIDDNSPDGTSDYAKQVAEELGNIYVLDRKKKDGLGRAYIAGFTWALQRDYKYIFEMDADFSHSPEKLPAFLEAIRDADLVIGSRYISGVNVINWPMSRLLLSYFGNLGVRKVAGVPVCDCTGGFKCFRREVLEAIDFRKISSSGYSFQVEMNYHVWKSKFRIVEIPIVFTDRKFGQSKMSTKIIREALMLLWKLRLRSIFSRD
jgi:dolichol-phosphate mannosyltransferase